MIVVLTLFVAFLAYANGANDNFKGVATLFGSGTASINRSIGWATICTLAGSVSAVALAGTLLKNFSGRGLIDETLVVKTEFAACVVIGASQIGMPVSTTHVSCGTLFGIGAVNRTARWRTILSILGAWLITLPIGAVMGAAGWSAVQVFFR